MAARILIADDDESILDSLGIALEGKYELVFARNGQQALNILAEQRVDVVVLDLMMPIVDGTAVIHALAERRVPLLVISAMADLAAVATRLGACDYLEKPFAVAALEEKLAGMLSRSA